MHCAIANILQPHIDAGAIAGVVALVASRDHVLEIVTLGMADIASNRSMRDNTLFWIASTTKPMTGALLMMLVDECRLLLDDPLEKYIPAFAGQLQVEHCDGDLQTLRPAAGSITIRQAMSHTSGLPFFSRPEKTIDIYPLSEAAMSYALTPRLFDAGSKYQYGNIGINAVGRIIEIVAGMPFEQFMRERLLVPLGMTDTSFVPTAAQAARLATNYAINEDKSRLVAKPITQLRYPLTAVDRTASPGGGLFSTARDTAKFGQMILNGGELDGHTYLSPQSLRTMTGTQTGTLHQHAGPDSGYGIGFETFAFETSVIEGSRLPGRCTHGGALSTHLDINPHTDRVCVFMVQQQGWKTPDAEQMRKQFNAAAGASGADHE